jgi:hypothetical protein
MEIFSYVEEGEPDNVAYITDAGKVMTWVPEHKSQRWCVHTHGEPWLDDKYIKTLEDGLRMITVPHDNCIDVAGMLRELHECDPFEDVEDNL